MLHHGHVQLFVRVDLFCKLFFNGCVSLGIGLVGRLKSVKLLCQLDYVLDRRLEDSGAAKQATGKFRKTN